MRLLAVILLSTLGVASPCYVGEAFIKAKIVPQFLPNAPCQRVEVVWNDKAANLGNELTPTQVKDEPRVYFPHKWGSYYSLIMLDIDALINGTRSVYEHWLVGNIPGDQVSRGLPVAAYVGAGVPKGDKAHRFIFLVYEQLKGPIKFQTFFTNRDNVGRGGYSLSTLVKKYPYKGPIAGNWFTAHWDPYVTVLFKQLGIPTK